MPVSRRAVTLKPSSSLTLAFRKPIKYHEWEFGALTLLDSKVCTQNYMALSSVVAFVSYFSTAGAEASNLPTVKFTPR